VNISPCPDPGCLKPDILTFQYTRYLSTKNSVKSHIYPKIILRISKIWRSSLCHDFDEIILLDHIHKQNR